MISTRNFQNFPAEDIRSDNTGLTMVAYLQKAGALVACDQEIRSASLGQAQQKSIVRIIGLHVHGQFINEVATAKVVNQGSHPVAL